MSETKLATTPTTDLATAVETARDYASQSRSQNTKRAYRADWQAFTGWCHEQGTSPLPAAPAVVAAYAAHLASTDKAVSTIARAMVSISQAHQVAGHASPTSSPEVRSTLQGIRRSHSTAPKRAKTPVMADQIKAMLVALPESTIGIRDRALLGIGFGGGLRRSEIVALDVEDVRFTNDGLEIVLRKSKTDQEGLGRKIGIPHGSSPLTCPVRGLRAWLDAAGITEGPIFRGVNRHGQIAPQRLSDKAVALAIKKHAEAVGIDPDAVAGHSLRSGFATSAAKAGKSERSIMNQTGHRSVTVMRRYIRDGQLFSDNAAAGLL